MCHTVIPLNKDKTNTHSLDQLPEWFSAHVESTVVSLTTYNKPVSIYSLKDKTDDTSYKKHTHKRAYARRFVYLSNAQLKIVCCPITLSVFT